MICVRCGKQISDDSKFCEYCGAKIDAYQGNMQNQTSGQPGRSSEEMLASRPSVGMPVGQSGQLPRGITAGQMRALEMRQSQQRKKTAIIAVAAASILLLVIVSFFHFYRKKINLADYVTVQYQGYDSFGTAEISFDYEKFYTDLNKKAKNLKPMRGRNGIDSLENLVNDASNLGSYNEICSDLEWKLDKINSLSNGDAVHVSFSFNNEKAKKYGIKYVGKTQKYTVEGLKEVREIDPFQDVSVEFSGTSPNVTASVQNNSSDEAVKSLHFVVSPDGEIQKGDTVTVTVDIEEDAFVEEYGCKLKSTSKEYTCDNVDAYIAELSELDEKMLSSMKSQTKDVINSYFADNRKSIRKSNLKYRGCYFLCSKGDNWDSENIIYVVFEGKVKSKDKSFKAKNIYFPVRFENIIQYADGSEYTDLDSTSIEGQTNLSYGWWSHIPGYTSKREMYSELVASKKGEYKTEESGKLK